MKNIIKKVHEFVKKNCEPTYFSIGWDLDNEMLGLSVFKVDDDFNNEYREEAEIIKQQLEKEFGVTIDNYCEPSSYEIECLDVRPQVYMELDYFMDSNTKWLDYDVSVDNSWNGKFSDEYSHEMGEEIDYGL